MTREEILSMKPGRELDKLVHENVFGIEVKWGETPVPFYSVLISAAWRLVEKLKIQVIPQSDSAPKDMKYLAVYEDPPYKERIEVFAETAEEAICKAALLFVMEV